MSEENFQRFKKKKTVTKTIEAWANIYFDTHKDNLPRIYNIRQFADEAAGINRLMCVKLTGTYEVEVEDE